MKAEIQTGLKGVVQIHREFVCRWLFSVCKSTPETSQPHTAKSWGRCIKGGIAVGYSAFLRFPLNFLLLVIARQAVVDELTQD